MVCIRPSSNELITPFLYMSEPPTRVQNLMCLIPTDTNWVSESGLNSTTKIRSACPALLVTLVPAGGGSSRLTPKTHTVYDATQEPRYLLATSTL